MPPKKIGLFTAALIVAHQIGSPAEAAVSADAVASIQAMVRSGETAALREYLATNPELTASDSPLSRALGEFLQDREGFLEQIGLVDNDRRRLADLEKVAFAPGIY